MSKHLILTVFDLALHRGPNTRKIQYRRNLMCDTRTLAMMIKLTETNLENTNSFLLVFDFLPEASLPTIYRNPAKTCQ